ncbi:response regulator transcription factor [Dyadobacter aurulentus]|uniref:response regulator transcription factor n=1 Tax=Dyadobacter sp. UC 10 TaxID=2605428 RepID=UPI0011F0BC00|nr:response regulator transcription factor [Dyadobacter sp. UC 10]KAA0993383.1 response regulator transcription factor [Dyadobacter sp. UC 10]
MIKVLIIEDHAVVRMGMTLVIREIFPEAEIFEAESFNAGLHIIQELSINLVVLDIHVPGGQDVRMIESIKATRPEIKVLVFSGLPEQKYALKYVQAGADGFLSKRSNPELYGKALAAVVNDEKYLSEDLKGQLVMQLPQNYTKIKKRKWTSLTDRELEISRLLIQGMWTKEIATHLQLKLSTISTFKKKIFQKCGITSTVELSKIIDDIALDHD